MEIIEKSMFENCKKMHGIILKRIKVIEGQSRDRNTVGSKIYCAGGYIMF